MQRLPDVKSHFIAIMACVACASVETPAAQQTTAPTVQSEGLSMSRRDAVVETIHGVAIADPYRWLEDEKSEEVKRWMAERDAHARSALARTPGRAELASRLEKLLYVETRSAPIERGGRLFWQRRPADREKEIWYWQTGAGGEAKVLIDVNAMSPDGSISIASVVPSHDGKKIAYMEKGNNADEATMRVMNVDDGGVSAIDAIPGLRYTEASWTPDGRGFYYVWMPSDPAIAPNERMGFGEVRFHVLGSDPKTDATVREKTGDPERWMDADVSKDGKYVVLNIRRGWSEHDVYVLRRGAKAAKWQPLSIGKAAIYQVVAFRDRFYVATNLDAPRWQVFVVDPNKLDRKHWKRIVPESEHAVIDSMSVIGGRLALRYLENASTRLEVRELDGKFVRAVELPAMGTASPLIGNDDADTAYFQFSSFTHPDEIFATSMKSGRTTSFAKTELPFSPGDFEIEQVWYTSKDETPVSMFLVHRRGLVRDGANPTILYGYGGFNISLTPSFRPRIVPWLERGGVYAVPNLRGGGEYGESWHRAGMLGNKQRVFDDFIAAAEWLIAEKITKSEKLAIMGRSNGGLLVGTAMTQRPDLFGAVVCGVPLLDMVRYHRFGIGKAWIPEYGDPENAEHFAWLLAYSPYHHVAEKTAYPALMMLSADGDDRVDPMHARKFTAAIEASSSSGRANLLRIESKAGHGGADVRRKTVEEAADELSFLISEIGTTATVSGRPSMN